MCINPQLKILVLYYFQLYVIKLYGLILKTLDLMYLNFYPHYICTDSRSTQLPPVWIGLFSVKLFKHESLMNTPEYT